MNYNWEEIFKNTSSQELYQIYKGQTPKTGEAIRYAKKELENRSFDFNNMEQNRKQWELLNTLEDETIDRLDFSGQKTSFISFKIYVLILIGTLIFFYLLNWYDQKSFREFIDLIPFAIGLSGIFVIINNLIYKRQEKKTRNRREKISKLKKTIEQQGLTNQTVFQKDLRVKNNEIKSVTKSQINIGIIFTIIFILTILYRFFVK